MKSYTKLYLFIIFGIIAVFLGFFCFNTQSMIGYYKSSIYWFMTLNCALWIAAIIESYSKEENRTVLLQRFYSFCKYHWFAFFLSLILMMLSVMAFKPDFRILADETNLLSVSQSFFNNKDCLLDCSSFTYKSETKDIIIGRLDKRPAFFPYLLSLIHSVLGYRPSNAFILNFITGLLSLFLIYYLIQLFWGRFWGINALICLAAYPLFIVYTNSGGFDVFNMMCSLVFFVCLYNYIKTPNALQAEVLLLWIPLLSQSRYESVLSIVIALPVVFYFLPKQEYSALSYKFVLIPFLFVPPAWLRIITTDPSNWQVKGGESVFSLEWFGQNLYKAVMFFTLGEEEFGVIPLISFLALIGFVVFISEVYFKKESEFIKRIKCLSVQGFRIFWGTIFVFFIFHAVAKLSYKLSDFTDLFASRHAIIFLPLFVFMAIVFCVQLSLLYSFKRVLYLIVSSFLILFYWPQGSKNLCGIINNELYQEFKFSREFLTANFPDKGDFIILSREAYLYTPLEYNSVYISVYNDLDSFINSYYNNKFCSHFLLFQTLNSQTKLPYKGYETPNGLETEIIFETHLQKDFIYRISRCIPKNEVQEVKDEK